MIKSIISWWVTVGGVGYLPMPGTMGSLVGFIVYMLFYFLGLSQGAQGGLAGFLFSSIFTLLSCLAVSYYLIMTATIDPAEVVIDEFIGMIMALMLADSLGLLLSSQSFVLFWLKRFLVFIFFRLFDITKMFPVNYAEKHPWPACAVMLDDLVAGGMAVGTVYFFCWFLSL